MEETNTEEVVELTAEELQEKLEKEGDFAADYLEELLDIADVDGDLEITIENERATVAIVSEDGGDRRLKRLIGKRGENLDALQELTRLAIHQKTAERSRLMLDVLGYRVGHKERIKELAKNAVEKVLETGDSYTFKPMNPFERKIIHDTATEADLFSDSFGYGKNRRVVISLFDEKENDTFDEVTEGDEVAENEE